MPYDDEIPDVVFYKLLALEKDRQVKELLAVIAALREYIEEAKNGNV